MKVVQRDTVDRVVYRNRVLRDTVLAITTPRYVLVRDTVYLEAEKRYPGGTARVDRASLSLLVGSRGE